MECITNQENYKGLANAIIIQAVKDYRKALKRLKKSPNKITLAEKDKIERFFHSTWFSVLSNLEGEVIINALQSEFA